ncbi:NADH:flavin oxidoreductase/NADH oxidase (plasmid) [Haloterrigena turkmenica DSM 5511]|uniref:NADH:flavin oxidoreductase/NADH oxidase n=1 Tax=Haloterrigena turkmenica (strain ATCC 51198 / DSM 5511 / JCM 9101 / NCIMB 13204 / VKM B-1734 / 4k) TaxID=543526 RepID=D2S010_HALTV|nr:FAD-dependent oxidoreductase [Haloterrigena turkmenica]ADB62707.1 NADH:flavin oxidoreductase/NADH oxidase [Haloterrigena turkmenica DSM 5511]
MELHESGRIGDLEIPNRGVFRPVRTRFVDDGAPTTELAAHLGARAAGGAGLVAGPAQMLVHPSASGPSYIDAYDEDAIEGLAAVADAVHEAGSAIVGQLTHTGGEEGGDWEMQAQLAPSASPSDAAYEMPKAMDRDEIRAVQDGFAAAARNLEEAGFDGVELNAGAFSVLRQFLSPRYNVRADEYGGDWESRVRFVNEAIARVSDATSGPVGLHLSLAELEYGGYEFEDVPEFLPLLERLDYLSCTVGTRATYDRTHAGLSVQAPDLLEPIRTAADLVDVPVIGRQPRTGAADAASLFDAGADFVSFTRQLLADERTVQKLIDGERHDRCIECNQKCLEGVYGHAHGGHVQCVVDPRTGRETDLPPLDEVEPAALNQRVLVVGGGPAGMRFAAIAARRGHDVTLREADAELGGQLQTAAQGPLNLLERAEEDLVAAVREAGVTVERESRVTADALEPEWDAVVVATGGTRPGLDEYDFDSEVVDAFDVLEGASVGDDVLLFDDNRWVIAFQTGLKLLEDAAELEIVATDHYPGFTTEQPNLPGFVSALQAQGATFTGNHTLEAVGTDGTATLRNTLTGDRTTRTPDTVVVAGRRRAEEGLYLELKERRDSVYRIGDAVSPRKLDRAYYDGERLARRL